MITIQCGRFIDCDIRVINNITVATITTTTTVISVAIHARSRVGDQTNGFR